MNKPTTIIGAVADAEESENIIPKGAELLSTNPSERNIMTSLIDMIMRKDEQITSLTNQLIECKCNNKFPIPKYSIGDTIYTIEEDEFAHKKVLSDKIYGISIEISNSDSGIFYFVNAGYKVNDIEACNECIDEKYVYASKEEAQQALSINEIG